MKGRWLVVVFSSYLKLSLLELFMSILSPISQSFFLIFLSCHPFCPFFCGSRHFVWTFCWWELVVRWAGSLLALSFSLYHLDSCMFFFRVQWRCELKFLLNCLTAWRRVILLCLLAIRQPSWWSRKDFHWCLYRSFVFNDLEMMSCSLVVHGVSRHHRQTTTDWWRLLTRECTPWCSGISSSWSLLLTCELVSSKMMEAGILRLIKGELHPCFSSSS